MEGETEHSAQSLLLFGIHQKLITPRKGFYIYNYTLPRFKFFQDSFPLGGQLYIRSPVCLA